MVDSNNDNKFNLENIDENIQTFEEESDQYAGEDIIVTNNYYNFNKYVVKLCCQGL